MGDTIFWSESGLTVVQAEPGSLREIWSPTAPPIDAGWIDQGSFMLAYPGRCDLHALAVVDANGVPTSGGTPSSNVACNLIRSTSVSCSEITIFTSAGDLFSTNSTGLPVRSVDFVVLPKPGEAESSPRYHTLCEISDRKAQDEVYASA